MRQPPLQGRRSTRQPLAALLLGIQLLAPLLVGLSASLQPAGERVWLCTLQGLQAILLDAEQPPSPDDAPNRCALCQLGKLFAQPLLAPASSVLISAPTTAEPPPYAVLKRQPPAQRAPPIRAPPAAASRFS